MRWGWLLKVFTIKNLGWLNGIHAFHFEVILKQSRKAKRYSEK
jgi:hypothetical protein